MQQRTLIRTPDLPAFRQALITRALEGDPLAARRRVVIVPTRAAGELFRQAIEQAAVGAGRAVILPDILTRDEWLARLQTAEPDTPPLLPRVDREVLLERAARQAADRRLTGGSPFQLRPGLVSAMLDLYDELRRRQRTVRRFAHALFDQLRVERGTDRGSESLIHQTVFLGFAFLGYERAVAASGGLDEHQLRARILASRPALPFDHVLIAVADHPTDPRGLWPSDFDLLGRLGQLDRIDVVMTEESHDAGFRERLELELPGIAEQTETAGRGNPGGVLVRPGGPDVPDVSDVSDSPMCFISRDREEELRDVARVVLERAGATDGVLAEPTAVVFHRPLPYLYLAQQTLTDARVPYQAFDALPLAAEPYAALLEQVLSVARTEGGREAVIGLLRSALLTVDEDGARVEPRDVSALDAVLRERRASGGAATFEGEVEAYFETRSTRHGIARDDARRAARAAARVSAALDDYRRAGEAGAQVAVVATFLRRFERLPRDGQAWADRHRRARAAVLGLLDGLAAAYARHDNAARKPEAIAAAILHAVEGRTFTPRHGHAGVHLLDAVAARFGAFDHVHLVGLVETDWPERPRRSVFYSSGLLKALSWPQEPDQMRAHRAAFRDLLGLAARTTRLHAFELEGDAVVAPSPILDLARQRPFAVMDATAPTPVFADELLIGRGAVEGLDPDVAAWLALRRERPSLDDPRYAGLVESQPPTAYRVSRVDRYADCPFKYFAASILRLPEERDEAAGLTPIERGTLLHELFEHFYRGWQADGRGAITPERLPEAIDRFASLTRDALRALPAADRVLEESRLLGSLVARGVAERVFELEADTGRPISDRLLEVELNGSFAFPKLGGLEHVAIDIRGKADRIDVFDDGSIGVIDYKLGKVPYDHSVQVAVYAHCARQQLAGAGGALPTVRSAAYLAFGDDYRLEGPVGKARVPAEIAVEERAGQFAVHVEQIEAGVFPARPARPGDCQWCPFAGVCRKEYRIQDDDAADAV